MNKEFVFKSESGHKRITPIAPIDASDIMDGTDSEEIVFGGSHYKMLPRSASLRMPEKDADSDLETLGRIRNLIVKILMQKDELSSVTREIVVREIKRQKAEEIAKLQRRKEDLEKRENMQYLFAIHDEDGNNMEVLDPEIALEIVERTIENRQRIQKIDLESPRESIGTDELDDLVAGFISDREQMRQLRESDQ
ncbi:hypothetical protein KKB18_04115 [bacterium]|nr:hypothetical protein [Patescibacteria group bacterium]MBU1626533.1 hypothetical protein [bacterium]